MRRSPLALVAAPLAGCLFSADGWRERVRELDEPPPPAPTDTAAPCEVVSGFLDGDGDGLGGEETTWCAGEPEGVRVGGDCDDADPGVGGTSYEDGDGDGAGGDTEVPGCGGPLAPTDCDDADAEVFPGALDWAGDGVDQDCADGDEPCGLRRVRAGEDLQAAVDAACPGDTLRIDGGVPRDLPVDLTASPDHPRAGLHLEPLDPAVSVSLRVDAPAGPAVRLDDDTLTGFDLAGSSDAPGGCAVVAPGRGVVLRDVTFGDCAAAEGGGLSASRSEGLRLEGVRFLGCAAGTVGGAARIGASPGLVFEDVEVRATTARFVGGVTLDACDDPVFRRVTFADVVGGALDVDDGSGVLRIEGGAFEANEAAQGADAADGSALQLAAPALALEVVRTTFRGNTTSENGGSIAVLAAADVRLEEDTFEDDAAGAAIGRVGGSVWITSAGDVTVSGGSFARSSAFAGGALAVTGSGSLAIDGVSFEQTGIYADEVGVTVLGSSFAGAPVAAIETGADRTDLAVADTTFTGGGFGLLLGLAGDVSVTDAVFDGVGSGVVASDASGAIDLVDVAFTGGADAVYAVTSGSVSLTRVSVAGGSGAAVVARAGDRVAIDDLSFVDPGQEPVLEVAAPTVALARLRVPGVPSATGFLVEIDSAAPSLAWSTILNPGGVPVSWASPGSFATMVLDHVVLVASDVSANALVVGGGGNVTDLDGASVATGVVENSVDVPNVAPIALDADLRLVPGTPGSDVGPDGCTDRDGSPCDAGYWGGPDAP